MNRHRLAAAARPVLETLEGRRLLAGDGLDLSVNFGPASAVPAGGFDLHDGGHRYGVRGDFGWLDNSGPRDHWNNGDRDHPRSPSQAHDTLVWTGWQPAGLRWEKALPAGDYRVSITAGDAAATRDLSYRFDVEGRRVLDAVAPASDPFVTGTATVRVDDGRLTLSFDDSAGQNTLAFLRIEAAGDTPPPPADDQSPYPSPRVDPRRVEAEHYDNGGEGVAFHDSDAKQRGNNPRGDAVDVWSSNGIGVVGWAKAGEWLEYTLTTTEAAEYDLVVNAATGKDGSRLVFTANGGGLASVGIGNRGWGEYREHAAGRVSLPAGEHVVRLAFARDGGGNVGNVDWFELRRVTSQPPPATQSPYPSRHTLPARIEAEHYDRGGEGVAFHDTDPTGRDNPRGDAVDVSGGVVGWTRSGEWLEYILHAPAAGRYAVSFRAATGHGGSEVRVSTGNAARAVPLVREGWGTMRTYDAGTLDLPAGDAVIRVAFHNADGGDTGNLDWIELAPADDNGGDLTLGSWRTQAGVPDRGAMEGTVAELDGRMYVIGGFRNDGTWTSLSRTLRYDPATDAWQRLADFPVTISHAAAATHGGRIYVFGGHSETHDPTAHDAVRVYDPAADRWTTWPHRLPLPMTAHALAQAGSRVYLAGGIDPVTDGQETLVAHHWTLDLADPAAGWTRLADLPAGRVHGAYVHAGGANYYVSGQENHDPYSGTVADVFRYDLAADSWSRVAALPDGGRGHVGGSTVVHAGRIVVAGGNARGSAGDNVRGDVFAYDPTADRWTTLGHLPGVGRYAGHAAVLGDRLVFAGGITTWPRDQVWSADLI